MTKENETVFVLSQLDPTYFRGLEGQYRFELDFTISTIDGKYIVHVGKR
jgi:hypothetical protein